MPHLPANHHPPPEPKFEAIDPRGAGLVPAGQQRPYRRPWRPLGPGGRWWLQHPASNDFRDDPGLGYPIGENAGFRPYSACLTNAGGCRAAWIHGLPITQSGPSGAIWGNPEQSARSPSTTRLQNRRMKRPRLDALNERPPWRPSPGL